MAEQKTDNVIWWMDTLGLFGRLGGKLAAFCFVGWLFLRAIEQTEKFAPVALAVSAGFIAWALFRLRAFLHADVHGVPIQGTVSGFGEYSGASHSRGSFRFRQMRYVYDFDGQSFQGK